MHQPPAAVIVIDGVMQGAAVVPDRERALRPAEAAGEFRPLDMGEQEIEKRPALALAHILEAGGVNGIDEERLAPALGMQTDDGMGHLALGLGIVALDLDRA